MWAVAVTVQMTAASRAESSLREPPAFFLVTTGPRIALSAVVIQADHRVVAVRGTRPCHSRSRVASAFCFPGGFLQAGGGHLLLPRLVDRGERGVAGGACLAKPGSGGCLVPRCGRGGLLPGGHELLVGTGP
jgi:hypothetical protein